MRKYVCSYRYDGAQWQVEIMAANHEDAEARIRAMRMATVDGEALLKVPVGFDARCLAVALAFVAGALIPLLAGVCG